VKHRAEFILITAAMGFALGGIAAKVLREANMDAFRLTQIRTSSAAIILLAFVLLRNKSQMRATKGEIKDLIIFGIIGIAAVTSFYFFAIKYLYVSVALIIEFTAPIWIVLYLRFIKKKSVPTSMWWGITFAFSGLLLISQIWLIPSPTWCVCRIFRCTSSCPLLYFCRSTLPNSNLTFPNYLGNVGGSNFLGVNFAVVELPI
jgi:drug/metabolite transporter (DMT)-like permease